MNDGILFTSMFMCWREIATDNDSDNEKVL